MKPVILRFLAVILLVVPGFLATYGFLQIKDALFIYFSQFGEGGAEPVMNWIQLVTGIVLFSVGVSFIGGWIFYRDRKRNYLAPRFRAKKK
jgi:hypothetical protein